MLALLAPLRRVHTHARSQTSPDVVRLAGVDAGGKEAAKRDGFRALWRKVKPEGYPSEVRLLSDA